MSITTAVKSVFGSKGFGWKRDVPDLRDKLFRAPCFGSSLPKTTDLSVFVPGVLDQGATNSCVAHAVAMGYCVALGSHNRDAWMPSRLFLYWNSRRFTGDEHRDEGTFLRTCIAGMVKFGAPPEELCQFSSMKVNRMPPASAYHGGYDHRGPAGYYRIASFGNDRARDVQHALSMGYPVAFGSDIDEPFLNSSGPSLIDAPGIDVIGGHAMCAVGYDGDAFRVVNSWGSGWRNGGYFWMKKNWLVSDAVSDIWVIVP